MTTSMQNGMYSPDSVCGCCGRCSGTCLQMVIQVLRRLPSCIICPTQGYRTALINDMGQLSSDDKVWQLCCILFPSCPHQLHAHKVWESDLQTTHTASPAVAMACHPLMTSPVPLLPLASQASSPHCKAFKPNLPNLYKATYGETGWGRIGMRC